MFRLEDFLTLPEIQTDSKVTLSIDQGTKTTILILAFAIMGTVLIAVAAKR